MRCWAPTEDQKPASGGRGRRAGAKSPPPALPLGHAASTGRSRRGVTGAASAAGGLRSGHLLSLGRRLLRGRGRSLTC